MDDKKSFSDTEVLEKFCHALDIFGAEQMRRSRYCETLVKFSISEDVRHLLNQINVNESKQPYLTKLATILKSNRDEWLDFIKNANKGDGFDAHFEESD